MNKYRNLASFPHVDNVENDVLRSPDADAQPLRNANSGPTKIQLAARQYVARDLETFYGDPLEWPLFYSTFCNSTETCGLSDAENLARLQRCLKGKALDAVRSSLLVPETVSDVMDTLKMLFGKPEVLVFSLLQKLRDTPGPKQDNVQSIINFGLMVKNVVNHMVVFKLTVHLSDPTMLKELIEKLPIQMQVEWCRFKRGKMNVNLETFKEFMSEYIEVTSDVAFPLSGGKVKNSKEPREKQRLFLHADGSNDESQEKITASVSRPIGSREKTCVFCNNSTHEIASCVRFKDLEVEERWNVVKHRNLCRVCLIPHRRWPCRSNKECEVEGCRVRHHTLLHSSTATDNNVSQSTDSASTTYVSHHNVHILTSASLFRYLPVVIRGGEKEIKTVAFLDDGSSSSLLDAKIAEAIGLEGVSDSFFLSWTSNISREEKNSKRVAIELRSINAKQGFKLGNVRTVNELKLPRQSLDYDEMQKHYPHLRGLPVESYDDVSPGIIIGIEHVHLLTQLKIREGRQGEPVAVKTRIGWCVFGKQLSFLDEAQQLHVHCDEYMDNMSLHQQMSKFYGIEEASTIAAPQSDSDKLAVEILNKTTLRLQDRFETGLPWKFKYPDFPESFEMAKRRMVSLERRLQKNPQLAFAVQQQVSSYLEKNYAHIATKEELAKTNPRRVWYLPLGVVQNPKKPGKVRLIWDAAARVNNISFNDMLLTGPDLLTSLPCILLRFRQRNIAVCGDIKEMFHQIRIRAQDSQSQRFLYRANPKDQPQVYVMDVVTFGATCSPFISQFIKNKNARDHAVDYPEAAEAIIKNHYMDDYLQSLDTVEEAVTRVLDVKYVHARGGFEIRNFLSNSPEVLTQIGESKLSEKKSLNLEPGVEESDRAERILGMMWLPASDHLTFSTGLYAEISKFVGGEFKPTKRQEIWKHGSEWDEQIPDELFEKWNQWSELLKDLDVVRVPRCFFSGMVSNEFESLQLHMFVDASEAAYACVAYLRVLHHNVPRCAFVTAKTKVAPLRPLSIPRLELQAALKGSREMNNICSSLDLHIKQRFLWTDSQTVLAWLRSDSRKYHQFVSYRVGEILSTTTISEWRYIPSKLNVADKATKWDSGPEFSPDSIWFKGPSFLLDPESEWPQDKKVNPTTQDVRIHFLHHFEAPTYFIIDPTRFSLWSHLLRTTTFIIRAINKFRKSGKSGILTSEEFQAAENVQMNMQR
ncbi:uncharacterized protein LOC129758643 [Uranotaenia lowii]|uniref:uncharacterized protein LOC129758643 n=1 Tax=Uranotaenia lowii TaxID=190385 RepID=UPI0024799B1E|nr:uncharacterized protein LOC129758643 [Uranotaenia lowii]